MSKQIIQTDQAPAPIGPYSQAVQAGNLLFVSGQVALNPQSGQMENADIASETRQVLRNLEAILTKAGFSWAQVVKSTIFLKDLNDFGTVNGIYGEKFPSEAPARETVEVAGLPRGARVEISVIAAK